MFTSDTSDLIARKSAKRLEDARGKLRKAPDAFENSHAGQRAIAGESQNQFGERVRITDNAKVGGAIIISSSYSGAANSHWRWEQGFMLVLNVKVVDCP